MRTSKGNSLVDETTTKLNAEPKERILFYAFAVSDLDRVDGTIITTSAMRLTGELPQSNPKTGI